MIISKIVGGLGNQMFQYAAGFAAAKRNKTELKMDLTWFDNIGKSTTQRKYELDNLRISAKIATKREILRIKLWRGSYAEKILASRLPLGYKLLSLPKQNYHLEDVNLNFKSDILSIKDDAYLDGNWQSEKYFIDFSSNLRKEFEFKSKLDRTNSLMLKTILSSNSVSIHVRRADYITNKYYLKTYTPLTNDYYRRALRYIQKKYSKITVFIFSDDQKWIRNNFNLKVPMIFVDINSGATGYNDMRLMANCQHNIMANSSFSWWGAWLNKNPQKMVIAPDNWFLEPAKDTRFLIPPEWVRI